MKIESIRKSISEMPYEEAEPILHQLRKSRMTPKQAARKSVQTRKKKATAGQKLLRSMDKEELRKLLKEALDER